MCTEISAEQNGNIETINIINHKSTISLTKLNVLWSCEGFMLTDDCLEENCFWLNHYNTDFN